MVEPGRPTRMHRLAEGYDVPVWPASPATVMQAVAARGWRIREGDELETAIAARKIVGAIAEGNTVVFCTRG